MSRDIEMDHASTMMCEHDEDEQNFEPDRVYREEVDRNELGHMIGEELSTFGMAAWDGGPCIWQRTPAKSLCPVSGVRREFEALPQIGLSRLMVRIRSRASLETRGRPDRR